MKSPKQLIKKSLSSIGSSIQSIRSRTSVSVGNLGSSSLHGSGTSNQRDNLDSSSHSNKSWRSARNYKRQQSCEEERPQYLLERLGGMVALKSILLEFSRRVTRDPQLQAFFQGVDPRVLTAHQERFFAMAFTQVHGENARVIINRVHGRMFAQGLNEEHFDVFARHLAELMTNRGFGDAIVGEVLDVLRPLRTIFKDASYEFRNSTRNSSDNKNQRESTVGHPIRA